MGNRPKIAIYMRLSKSDELKSNEVVRENILDGDSNSIQMQREMLRSYVRGHFSDYQLLEFCDDGYSGTNFNRPGVTELLERVKESSVDCIVVKDFSRFSRDYIELGSYIDRIFPFMGVRFISVNDGYDSSECSGGIGEMDVSFKHLLYDLYSKDLSVKVKSSLAIRKESGQYISTNCPFGYEKAPNDKHMLLVERDEAEIVRRIFSLTLEGYTSVEIARKFNQDGVKTPIEFKIAKGKTNRVPKGGRFSWSSSTIRAILLNEVYVGDMVYGKTEKRTPGGKSILKPRNEWRIFHDHHEPIINRETFEIVQLRRGVAYEKGKRERHPLAGKLVCGCCGKNLIYRADKLNPYFRCPSQYDNPKENSVRKVNGMFLEQCVLFEIQQRMQDLSDVEKFQKDREKTLLQSCELQRREISSLKMQRKEAESEKLRFYERYRKHADGNAWERDTMEYREKMESIAGKLQELDIQIQDAEAKLEQTEEEMRKIPDIADLIAYDGASELTGEIVQKFIEKIVVTDEEHLEVFWKDYPDCKEESVGGDLF